jgi:hypothetical protein
MLVNEVPTLPSTVFGATAKGSSPDVNPKSDPRILASRHFAVHCCSSTPKRFWYLIEIAADEIIHEHSS